MINTTGTSKATRWWRAAATALTMALVLVCVGQSAHAAPPQLSDVEIPTQILSGAKQTFRIRYKDADGDLPKKLVCAIEGPGGTERKEYTATGSDADARAGFEAEFPMGPFALDGQYSVRFEAETGDGKTQTPPQQFVVINLTKRYIELAVGLLVCLLFVPALVFLFVRMLNRNGDPRRAARLGLLCGIVLGYLWYVYLFGALHQVPGIIIGAIVLLAAIVAIFSGTKDTGRDKPSNA